MVRAFVSFLLVVATAKAFACPDLTGNYTCTYEDGSQENIYITQEDQAGVTAYNYNGADVIADGVVRPLPDSDTLKNGTLQWSCDQTSLIGEMKSEYDDHGQKIGDLQMTTRYTLVNNNLVETTTGALAGDPNGNTEPINQQTICARSQGTSVPLQKQHTK